MQISTRIQNTSIQKSNIPKIQNFLHLRNRAIFGTVGFLDFWILGFWIFGLLDFYTCFQSVETAPKLDSEKTAFVSVFTVFLMGVRVVGGGDHIYRYVCYPPNLLFIGLLFESSWKISILPSHSVPGLAHSQTPTRIQQVEAPNSALHNSCSVDYKDLFLWIRTGVWAQVKASHIRI